MNSWCGTAWNHISQGNSSVGTTSIGWGCFRKSSWKGLNVNFLIGCFSNCGLWPEGQEITLVSHDQIFFFNEIEWNQMDNSRVYYWLTAYNVFLSEHCDPEKFETHCPILRLVRGCSTPVIRVHQPLSKMVFYSARDGERGTTFPSLKKSPFIFLLCLFLWGSVLYGDTS